jgi:L-rhamnose mutarotase
MGRAVFRMRAAPGAEAVYRERHRAVWPEVEEALRRSGFTRYSIFMAGTELIAYFEADDPADSLQRMRAEPAMHRWWAWMDPVMAEEPADAHAYVEVYHLD